MKTEEFRKQKEKYEKRTKKQITDEEFERLLKKQQKFEIILWLVCLIIGLAVAADWPGHWIPVFGQFSNYLGLVIVVFSVGYLIKNIYLMFKR